jgi:hypothetical protein
MRGFSRSLLRAAIPGGLLDLSFQGDNVVRPLAGRTTPCPSTTDHDGGGLGDSGLSRSGCLDGAVESKMMALPFTISIPNPPIWCGLLALILITSQWIGRALSP